MKASICMSTFKKAGVLGNTIKSIVSQEIPFEYEIIIVDDGNNEETRRICESFDKVKFIQLEREPVYRNPSVARNVAYKAAKGEVVICQSDEVIHITPNAVERLVLELQPKSFSIATVYNTDIDGNGVCIPCWNHWCITGSSNKRPLFFLGSILRSDLYAAGGNDERYVYPAYEDDAFANALIHGLGLKANYVNVVGHHIDHPRTNQFGAEHSEAQYRKFYAKQSAGLQSWLSPSAPWPYE